MASFYLDNNIIADLEMGKRIMPLINGAQYFYSFAHLEELKEAKANLPNIMGRRLQMINALTNGKFLLNDNKHPFDPPKIVNAYGNPYTLFGEYLSKTLNLDELLKKLQNNTYISDTRKELVNAWDIETIRQNNFKPEKLVETHKNFFNYYLEQTAGDNRYSAFQSLFAALDLIGFWTDKKDDFHANVSRSYDAQHAYYASACDYFVTNDRGCHKKSEIAYYLWEYKTKVISFQEFYNLS